MTTSLTRLVLLSTLTVSAGTPLLRADKLSYQEYLSLDEETRAKLVKQYVRDEGKFQTVSINTYTVLTDVSPEYAVRIAVLMDEFYARFSTLLQHRTKPREPPSVYVLNDAATYAQAVTDFMEGDVDPSGSAGMYCVSGDRRALFADRSSQKVETILFHEGTHQLMDYLTELYVADWLDEGVATNFEYWEMTRTVENNLHNNLYVNPEVLALLEIYPTGFVPLSKLMTLSREEFDEPQTVGANYTSSWVSGHYLLTTKQGRNIFNRLIQALRKGKPLESVLRGNLIRELEKRIREHIDTVVLPHARHTRVIMALMKEKQYAAALKAATEMKRAFPENQEAEFYRAWLLALSGDDVDTRIKTLRKLAGRKFPHPEIDFAIAQAYRKKGDESSTRRAKSYARKMLKQHVNHEGAKALLRD